MAAKEKLVMLERERTKKEKEKIQAERKRKAAQFLASMKIIPSLGLKANSTILEVKSETAPNSNSSTDYYINNAQVALYVHNTDYLQVYQPKIL